MKPVLSYALALVPVLVVAVLRWLLAPWLDSYPPYLLFAFAVLVSAFLSELRPAIFAAVVAMIVGALFAGPRILEPDGLIITAIFAANAAAVILLVAALKRSRRHAAASDLEARQRGDVATVAVEELNLLIDGARGVAMTMIDPNGEVTIWNSGAERLNGWSEDEIVGRNAELFYPADAVSEHKLERDLAAARARGRFEEEEWQVRKDGSEFLASVSMTALHTEDGALRGFARIVRDVTDQRAAETALKANEDHLRSILAAVPDAMVVIDERGTILSFSAVAEQLFGYSQEEIIGDNVKRLMPAAIAGHHNDYLDYYLRTGERRVIGIGRTVTAIKKDGTTFPMELSVGEAETRGRKIFTGFVRDLTERQATEARMQALQSELIHVSRVSAMGTMASTLAHELNQPITAVVNYMEAVRDLLDSPDPEDVPMIRDALGEAAKESLRAGEIVRRLRNFVARGEVARTIENLPDLINEAAVLALMGIREKGVSSRFDLDPLASPVLADRVQIQQVLTNLIRNAVDAMEASERRELTVTSSVDQPGFVRITVADTGPGISTEIIDKLFAAFVSTKMEGMGLGLSICRTIVEAHGGKIWAESDDRGSRFHFTLVLAEEDAHDG